jgi:hypothetical protein
MSGGTENDQGVPNNNKCRKIRVPIPVASRVALLFFIYVGIVCIRSLSFEILVAATTLIISNMIFSQQHATYSKPTLIEEAAGMILKRRMMTHLEILEEAQETTKKRRTIKKRVRFSETTIAILGQWERKEIRHTSYRKKDLDRFRSEVRKTVVAFSRAQETPKKRRTIKNRVRFSETTMLILGQRERKEIRHTWYRKIDLDLFRSEVRKTVVDFSRASGQITLLQPEEYCLRGLEHYASAYIMSLHKDKKRSHSQLILNQQELQRHSHDPNSLKIISMISSRSAREFSLRLGALYASLRCKTM